MFTEWPLADPVFSLQWQVHVTTVALFAILGVWWSVIRLPWYAPPAALLALLWLFVPLEAPDPAVALLIATPTLAALCCGIRWAVEGKRGAAEALAGSSTELFGSRWRFRLSDSLWLMFLIGLLCALVAQLWRMPWPESRAVLSAAGVYWPDIAINAACLIGITAAVYTVLVLHGWRMRAMAVVVALCASVAAAIIHWQVVRLELLFLADWAILQDQALNLGASQWGWSETFDFYLRTFLAFTTLVALGLVLLGIGLPRKWKRIRWIAQAASGLFLVVPLFQLTYVYREMVVLPDWPAESFPGRNRRNELEALLERHADVNPQNWSVDDLRRVGGTKGDAAAQQLTRLFAELEALVQNDEITMFDSRVDQPQEMDPSLNRVVQARNLSRSLLAQAKADWAAGRRASALKHDLVCLRLGAALQRRGTALEALIGLAIEGTMTHHLTTIRKDLTAAERQLIRTQLDNIADTRESQELLFARTAVYDARMPGWRTRLAEAARRIRKVQSPIAHIWLDASRRRDATLALLQTDLALRAYQQEHGHWPEELSQLVPDLLSRAPKDPYSEADQLRYRADDDGFVLYSVGPDANDDGGQFGNLSNVLHSRRDELDFDLETVVRP